MKKEILEWLKTIIVSVVIAIVITTFIRPTLVKGESMMPTLQPNNYLIINKVTYMFSGPASGDIVVFSTELHNLDGSNKDLIKRVIGVAGDTVEIKEGKVYINGELISEEYILGNYTNGDVTLTIPEGKIFVMGDNRGNSLDSRSSEVGLVKVSDIKGKVLIRLYPFNELGVVN